MGLTHDFMAVFHVVSMHIHIAAFLSEHFSQNNPSLCSWILLGSRVYLSTLSKLATNGFIPYRANSMLCADKSQMWKEVKK